MDDRNLDELEEDLITTLRVIGVLFGVRSADHANWARATMPPEAADHYIGAWKEGRRRIWKDLQRTGERMRKAAGDDGAAWQLRLAQLEALSGTRIADVKPTTQTGTL